MPVEGLDLLGQLENSFDRKPVSIVEFAESPKFCGKVLYPRQRLLLKIFFLEELTPQEDKILDYWIAGGADGQEIDISPDIRERMQWCKDNGYNHFHEIVLVGGRRCSKGFLTAISMAKLVYDLIQMQDPQQVYGIDKGKEIMFSVVAASEQQAKEMQYADFQSTINTCNAVQRNIYKTQELEFSLMTEADIRQVQGMKRRGRRVQRDESSIRGKAMAANARTIRGSATMGLVFDEFAFFMEGDNDQSAAKIYDAALPAVDQFIREGMIFCNSSPYSKIGKFYERYEHGMKGKEDEGYEPTMVALRFPSWALFEGWWEDPDYQGPKKCITASPDWDPDRKKLDEYGNPTDEDYYTLDDQANIRIARTAEAKDPITYKVERRGFFAEVIDAYLDPEKVDRMFYGRPDWKPNRTPELTYYPYDMNWTDATARYKYAAHIDPSSTTAGFGFALAHTETLQIGPNQEDIDTHVVFDVIQRWDPHEFTGGAIEWEPILETLLQYIWYFRPVSMTFDQHQNRWPMEWLQKKIRERGLGDTRVFEKTADIQRNWNRAEVFRTALYHNRVHAPSQSFADCKWASEELKYLQEIKTARVPRVEKQDVGPVQTKDVADCMMEVVEVLIGSEFDRGEALAQPMAFGAPGGYRLGGFGQVPDEISAWYSRRNGEQRSGGGGQGGSGNNPARRAFGGRPVPRSLPRRGLPGR